MAINYRLPPHLSDTPSARAGQLTATGAQLGLQSAGLTQRAGAQARDFAMREAAQAQDFAMRKAQVQQQLNAQFQQMQQQRQQAEMQARIAQQQAQRDAQVQQQRIEIQNAYQQEQLEMQRQRLEQQGQQAQAQIDMQAQEAAQRFAAQQQLQQELQRIDAAGLPEQERHERLQSVLLQAAAAGVPIPNVGHLMPGRQQTPAAPEAVSVDLPSGRQMEGVMSGTGRFFPAGKERDPEDVRAQMRLDFKKDQLTASRRQLNSMIGNPGVLDEELAAARREVSNLERELQKLIEGLPPLPAIDLPPIDEIRRQARAAIDAGKDPDAVARKFRELTGKDL